MNKKFLLFILSLLLIGISFFYFSNPKEKKLYQTKNKVKAKHPALNSKATREVATLIETVETTTELKESESKILPQFSTLKKTSARPVLENEVYYEIEQDGLATVDGDIVLGTLPEGSPSRGKTSASNLELWPGGKVPFFIQGDLEEGERVIKAIAMFAYTPIHLTPYQGEEDVLVFHRAQEGCKSYLGKIGGKQPIWISLECSPREIAHEIMHALGFIHEQNRSDRDNYVTILWDNILESSKKNFELFPTSLMKVSGNSAFDFQSIMLYPPKMFTKNGLPTLQSVNPQNEIHPGHTLSNGDKLRLEQAYLR